MKLPPPKVCRRMHQLHGLVGSPVVNEAETAREKLNKLLAEHSLTWNDLPAILAVSDTNSDTSARHAASQATTTAPTLNVLDLAMALIEEHVTITADERIAVALWILHTYLFERFPVTPRLALLSPVRECGKTTLLMLIELLIAEPYRTDNATAAAIYHRLDRNPYTTLLIDEADNLELFRNGVLRAVFNSGHRRGGGIDRLVGGWPRKFRVFAPLAVAAIGTLPLPLLQRAVVINMQRSGENRRRLDESDPAFAASREEIRKWAATCSLTRDPEVPPALRNRVADNWRVLLAIADDLGQGEPARSAAITLCSNHSNEDTGVVLLADIRTVFDQHGSDRIASVVLVEALLGLDDGFWAEWRGTNDDRSPRKLTQGELARLLRPFHIRSRTIWPKQRRLGDQSKRGYLRNQFEAVWRAYCPSSDTPTQASKISYLRHV